MNTTTSDELTRPGVSRRSVLRVGAHAAWAVPVVSVVTAAPALAASVEPVTLTMGGINWAENSAARTFVISINVTAKLKANIPDGTYVTWQFPKGTNRLSEPLQVVPGSVSSNWTNTSQPHSVNDSSWTYMFHHVGVSTTSPLGFTLKMVAPSPAQSVAVSTVATLHAPPPHIVETPPRQKNTR